jgi:hypothetical protein
VLRRFAVIAERVRSVVLVPGLTLRRSSARRSSTQQAFGLVARLRVLGGPRWEPVSRSQMIGVERVAIGPRLQ